MNLPRLAHKFLLDVEVRLELDLSDHPLEAREEIGLTVQMNLILD